MAWIQDFPGAEAAGERTEKAWRMPLGAVSPLWAVFGAAASAGVAYWWLTQWSRAAVNFEAFATVEPAAKSAPQPVELVAEPEPAPEPVVETAITPEPVVEAVAESAPAATEPEAKPVEVEPLIADDLTVMTGIGPKLFGRAGRAWRHPLRPDRGMVCGGSRDDRCGAQLEGSVARAVKAGDAVNANRGRARAPALPSQ